MNVKKIFLLLIMHCALCIVYCKGADEVRFTASAPQRVIVGQPFQLVFSVNENAKDLRLPDVKGFEILINQESVVDEVLQTIHKFKLNWFRWHCVKFFYIFAMYREYN
mgnify:CR=1 FL=1